MANESIYPDGEEVRAIRETAKRTGTIISVGISEKVRYSTATLFNSNLIIGSDGEVLVHHRKFMPTFFEKLTWSPGDGFGLRVAETKYGKIGALICGENTNPLARYALMSMGEQVHISSWPAIWPTRKTNVPSALDVSKSTQNANYDNVSANRIRAAAHCFEAKCFGILCAGHLNSKTIDAIKDMSGDPSSTDTLYSSSRAATMFLDPNGALHPSFTVHPESGAREAREMLQKEEGILYADLDIEQCVEGKQYHDVVGGYQRLDVFDLKVDRRRREPATFLDEEISMSH